MALQDFYGTYQIQCTAGTDCGLFTRVDISWDDAIPGVKIVFSFEHREPDIFTEVSYLPSSDALYIELESPYIGMWISRFIAPEEKDYTAIYGIILVEEGVSKIRRSPVWSAEREKAGTGPEEPVVDPTPADMFLGSYSVMTTTDVQFGIASTVQLVDLEGNLQLSIRNAIDQIVLADFDVNYFSRTVSIVGSSVYNGYQVVPPVRVSLSLALVEKDFQTQCFLYGLVLIGDPEQGGTFGGEEDPEADPRLSTG